MNMTDSRVQAIQRAMQDALDRIAAEHGVKFKVGHATYDTQGYAKISVEALDVSSGKVYTREESDFNRCCFRYGLRPGDLHAKFRDCGVEYEIIGARVKNRSYPLIVSRTSDGKRFKMPASMVAAGLRNTREANEKARREAV